MLSERSMLLACGGGFKTLEKELRGSEPNLVVGPPNTVAAAAAFLYLEKVKNHKLSPQIATTTTETPLSCEIQINSLNGASMESAAIKNHNNDSNQNNENNSGGHFANSLIINNARNAHSGPDISPSMSHVGNQLISTSQQSQSNKKPTPQNILSCTGNVKQERLSPSTNGDLQSTISRSRSTTPSSFRGPSPQQISTETLMPLTSLLRIKQATSADHQNPCIMSTTMDTASLVSATAADYSTRNYSDIMRSLAAKYNDSNPINPPSARRYPFFDTHLSTQAVPAVNKNITHQSANRSTASTTTAASPSKTNSQSNMMPRLSMSPGEVAVAAAAASFLSSFPFSQNVCPPLIDMSSTQALVTLARAAKEAEIHAILRSSPQNPKPLNPSTISPHPSLSSALHQAAQFVSPALIYSAQLQQKQVELKTSNQSSLMCTGKSPSINASTLDTKTKSAGTATTPLDLSSQPPSKRLKIESYDTTNCSKLDDSKKVSDMSLQMSESGCRSDTLEKLAKLDDSTTCQALIRQPNIIRQCQAQCQEVAEWSVDDVCAFVGEIDICAGYVQHFRDQCIDGSGLPLLTEDHLLKSLGMKLGPALKLRSLLAKKLGGPCPCVACISQTRQMLTFQASVKDGPIISDAVASAERPTLSGCTKSGKETSDTLINISNKAKDKNYERKDFEQKKKATEDQQMNKNDNSNSHAALTLQISANIYKNETNNNKHNKEKLNNENKKSLAKISNKSCDSSIDCVIDPTNNFISEDCKHNTSAGNNKSDNNGNLHRTGSGDIADVGS